MKSIKLKNENEINIMKEGGIILGKVLRSVLNKAGEGISLKELDRHAERMIADYGAEPSFKRVEGYKWTICASVNDVVVHGIPNEYVLKKGDVLGIDCGVYFKGYNTDCAWTIIVGDKNTYPGKKDKSKEEEDMTEVERFIFTGKNTLIKALLKAKENNYIYDISEQIQKGIEEAGYNVVKSLVGHGVGRDLHEAPEIPGYIKAERQKTPRIIPGMVLAVEVIYNQGNSDVVYKGNDGWTIATEDGTISGLFEATVAVTSHGSYVLTEL